MIGAPSRTLGAGASRRNSKRGNLRFIGLSGVETNRTISIIIHDTETIHPCIF